MTNYTYANRVGNAATWHDNNSTQCAEFDGLSESRIIDRILDSISDYFDTNVSSLYRRHLLIDWSENPNIRGTYSGYPDIDDENWVVDAVGNGKLYFAGESFPVNDETQGWVYTCLLYTSPSPRDS